ncbi:hypothetical protein PF011_g12332 [Phytophthora fragariae]|uniref:HTH CENPB-type domain-containing protein n=1 Tax=Phytophthora fragariae TaxID=53985 RepID=A0A6A3KAP9_9STRA|nr:hypothetical protein PF011_g12332 [Phytophthora fragariae]
MPRSPGQRLGRTRTTGVGKSPKRFMRVSVSYRFKRDVIQFYSAPNTMDTTVRKFFPLLSLQKLRVKKRQIYSWVKKRDSIEQKCADGAAAHCKAREVGIATTLPLHVEEHVVRWINSLRSEGVPVTGMMVRAKAKDSYSSAELPPGGFQASHTWLLSFLRRHRLSIRRRTHEGQKTPADADQVAAAFAKPVQERIQALGIDKVHNADQTAVNYEYLPATTVATKGKKTIWMKMFKTKPSKNAERAKVNADFQHGFGIKLWKELEKAQIGVQVYGNRAGWWNSELSIQFLSYHFLRRPDMHTPVLLILDDFSGHWRVDVQIFARLLNVELIKVSPGYTFACQPADIAWNKPVKDRLRANWGQQMLQQLRAFEPGTSFKLVAPTRLDLIAWTKAAWSSLSTSAVISGFCKAKIISRGGSVLLPAPPLASLSDCDEGEDQWEELFALVREYNVRRQVLVGAVADPTRDIETLDATVELLEAEV